jgi:hypothetical protein
MFSNQSIDNCDIENTTFRMIVMLSNIYLVIFIKGIIVFSV